jgi:hypothetical protein
MEREQAIHSLPVKEDLHGRVGERWWGMGELRGEGTGGLGVSSRSSIPHCRSTRTSSQVMVSIPTCIRFSSGHRGCHTRGTRRHMLGV